MKWMNDSMLPSVNKTGVPLSTEGSISLCIRYAAAVRGADPAIPVKP